MPISDSEPFMIGVDWGTSSFRAYLMAGNGQVMDCFSGPYGIRQKGSVGFEEILAKAVHELTGDGNRLPVMMCGMIGSTQGWQDAGYLSQNAGIEAFAERAVQLEFQNAPAWIIPGVKALSFDENPDVMRGEETALIGAFAQTNKPDGLFCLPGTHSKWVAVQNGQIVRLTTFMTGELFQLFSEHSVLAPLINRDELINADDINFQAGIELAAGKAGLLHQLFAIRAGILTGHYPQGSAKALLSGLVIASEISKITPYAKDYQNSLSVISDNRLGPFYMKAFQHFGLDATLFDSAQTVPKGLFAIGCALLKK